jgi:hypothetical protein
MMLCSREQSISTVGNGIEWLLGWSGPFNDLRQINGPQTTRL